MKPYYQDDAVTIYHGDCREIVPTLGKFDLLLTDPPYGVNATQKGRLARNLNFGAERWDQETESPEFFSSILNICGGRGIVWGGNCLPLPVSPCWLHWDKQNDGLNYSEFELAWTSLKLVPRSFRMRPMNMDGGKQHPTQKPIGLMTWCLSFAPDAQTILDPFAGSGTTGRAAKDLGRKATLIEREEKYCEIAAKRMAQEVFKL